MRWLRRTRSPRATLTRACRSGLTACRMMGASRREGTGKMFVSSANAADLLLPMWLWNGDATVTHTGGEIEIVRDVQVEPARWGRPKTARKRPDRRAKIERTKETK